MTDNLVINWISNENKYSTCRQKIAERHEGKLLTYVKPIGNAGSEQDCLLSVQVLYSPQIPVPSNEEVCLLIAEVNTPCSQLKDKMEYLRHILSKELGLDPNKHNIKLFQ